MGQAWGTIQNSCWRNYLCFTCHKRLGPPDGLVWKANDSPKRVTQWGDGSAGTGLMPQSSRMLQWHACHLLTHSACRSKLKGLPPQRSFPPSPQTSPRPSTDTTTLHRSYTWPGAPFLPRSRNTAGCRDSSVPPSDSFYKCHATFQCGGHIWLAVADVPINPVSQISSKTAMPREGGMETMALRRVFTKGIPRTSGLSQREVSSQLHLGNTWSSPPSTHTGLAKMVIQIFP